MAGRAEDFSAEAADGDGREVPLGLLEFDFLNAIEGLQNRAAQDVLEGLISGQKQGSIRWHTVHGLDAFFVAEEADAEALAAGEDEAGDIKQTEGVSCAADVGAEGIQAFVLGVD